MRMQAFGICNFFYLISKPETLQKLFIAHGSILDFFRETDGTDIAELERLV